MEIDFNNAHGVLKTCLAQSLHAVNGAITIVNVMNTHGPLKVRASELVQDHSRLGAHNSSVWLWFELSML